MIKVSGGARTLQGVGAHFDYIGRKGLNEIETDMGERLMERGFEKDLMLDWMWTWVSVAATPIEPSRTDASRQARAQSHLLYAEGYAGDKLEAAVRRSPWTDLRFNTATRWPCIRTRQSSRSRSRQSPE